ncbi:hypothetical protein KVG29_04905 [Caldicoprobacter algeriensis]|uniref:hypothetical protein n=1 Tax=Caldicoprobacter algeriensis TaxID=699281 RepID=UPI00207A22E9|nr:hypothetical protein [Caldicoprobacter algeriensis]MCM8900567.1 hypothetical protein [Caldicoprobacter algeriensis]
MFTDEEKQALKDLVMSEVERINREMCWYSGTSLPREIELMRLANLYKTILYKLGDEK